MYMGTQINREPYTTSVIIYLISLATLYLASTLYHATFALGDTVRSFTPITHTPPQSLQPNTCFPPAQYPRVLLKPLTLPVRALPCFPTLPSAAQVVSVFTILDHSAIYLLIAGTYTPFLRQPMPLPPAPHLSPQRTTNCAAASAALIAAFLAAPPRSSSPVARLCRSILFPDKTVYSVGLLSFLWAVAFSGIGLAAFYHGRPKPAAASPPRLDAHACDSPPPLSAPRPLAHSAADCADALWR